MSDAPRPSTLPITTILTPAERLRVDAAGEGAFYAMHRESIDDVLRDLRERRAGAVVVSVARCAEAWTDGRDTADAGLTRLVREFPRVTAVALLSQPPHHGAAHLAPRALLALGQSGVRTLVDAREPSGWRELRHVLAGSAPGDFARHAALRVVADLGQCPDDCARFFEVLFARASTSPTVRPIATALGVSPATLLSRFFRARLPSPRRYLALARLAFVAHAMEEPGVSVAGASNGMDYSSPQAFGRHVRTLLGLTAVQFRRKYDGEGMLQRFRDELVIPHAETLRTFTPLERRAPWTRGGGDGLSRPSPPP